MNDLTYILNFITDFGNRVILHYAPAHMRRLNVCPWCLSLLAPEHFWFSFLVKFENIKTLLLSQTQILFRFCWLTYIKFSAYHAIRQTQSLIQAGSKSMFRHFLWEKERVIERNCILYPFSIYHPRFLCLSKRGKDFFF